MSKSNLLRLVLSSLIKFTCMYVFFLHLVSGSEQTHVSAEQQEAAANGV
jgi:hypothetical protein